MWLTHVEADRLRNLKAVHLDLPPGLTVVFGRNGQGKSSLLEAVYLLATGRSFRTRRLDDLTSWDGGPLRVSGEITGGSGQTKLTVVMHDGERSLLADGLDQRLENFLGRLDLIDLTAERMLVLRGSPEERRRFVDRGVVGIRPGFLLELGEYRRVLQQRNALLRRLGPGSDSGGGAELDAWDERLIRAAGVVHRARREYAVLLAAELGKVSQPLFPHGAELVLRYRPSPRVAGEVGAEEFEARFAQETSRSRIRDRTVGHTCRGPHRDEMTLEMDGVDLRRFGSAGQVRASMIALKLGKLSLLQKDRGEAPLFLMDDFDSDLDEGRASALAAFLEDGGFQVLVATSKETIAERLGVSFNKVRMDGGVVRSD